MVRQLRFSLFWAKARTSTEFLFYLCFIREAKAEVDRLSDLSDHVLLKIISLIPIREAVGTLSCLSSRWKDLHFLT